MNDFNKNVDKNTMNTSNYDFSNSNNISTLIQRLKTNQGTKDSEFDDDKIKEKLNLYLIGKQYKDAIRFIEVKEKIIDDNSNNYLFFDIKIKCFYKLINSYLSTYKYRNKLIEYLPSMKVSITLEKMFSKLIKYFKDIIPLINLEICNESLKEKLIQNYCEGLYLIAKFHKIKSQPQDATAYLSISHAMLKTYIDKCKDPYTFQIYEKILILLISLLIDDNSFFSAKEYSIFCLRLCIKELFLRNKSEKGIKIKYLPYIIKQNYKEIFQNITLCLFLMGICYEHLGDLVKAIDSYRQSSWFISKFYLNDNTKLFQIIQGTYLIASKFYDFIIEKKRNKDAEIEIIEKENKKKQKDNKKLKELNKISYGMIYDLDKNPKITKFLNNEIQFNKSGNPITVSSYNFNVLSKTEKEKENYPSQATINMIDNVVLYNDLLSKDYQQFIHKINDINFNHIDKDLLDKLERYNRDLIIDKKKKIVKTQVENIHIKNNSSPQFYKIVSPFYEKKSLNRYKEHKDFYLKKKKKNENRSYKSISNSTLTTRVLSATKINNNIFEKIENRNDKENNSQKGKNKLFYRAFFSKKVERYPLSNSFLFNRSYQKKRKILEKTNNREIRFQKDILFLKKIESKILKDVENEDDSTVRGINQANFSFNLIKEQIYKKVKKPKILFQSSSMSRIDLIEKMNHEKYKIRNSLIAGLNPKQIEKMKSLDKNIIIMRNKQLSKMLYNNSSNSNKMNNHSEREIDNDFDENIKKISKVNESVISSLDKDINNFIKKEKFIHDLKK